MKMLVLQPPSPPRMNVKRDYAGGFGIADPSDRDVYGHDEGYIVLPYMSLLYSAAVLKRDGYDVSFLDCQAERLGLEQVTERIRAIGPSVIVAVVNLPSIYGDLRLLRSVKERSPRIKIVAIGTVTIPCYDIIAGSGAVDVIIRGDPEAVIPGFFRSFAETKDLMAEGFVISGGAITNKEITRVRDLDSLPRFPYELMNMEKSRYHVFSAGIKYAPVFSSRGCSFRCYYCPYPVGFGGDIVYRDPVKVIDEVEDLYREHGVRGILFRDQVFTMNWERVEKICGEIIKRGLKIEWVVETRLDRVNEAILRKMKKAGCKRVHYGLESGDPRIFSACGKDSAEGKMKELIKNFTMTESLGIGAHMFILIGLLGETWETIRNTVDTIKKIKPLTIQAAVVTPYPGTKLFDEVKEKGLLLTEDWSQYTGFGQVMRTESILPDELLKMRKFIIDEHRRAVYLKRFSRKIGLAAAYMLDGSILRRLFRKITSGRAAAMARSTLKRIGCKVFVISGGVYIYREIMRMVHGNRVRILSLHKVGEDGNGHLSIEEFKKRILYIKKHYRFVAFRDLLAKGKGQRAKNAVILTFDDGYKDVYTNALNFLREEKVPFALFVTTGFIGRSEEMLKWGQIAEMASYESIEWGAHTVHHKILTGIPLDEAREEILRSRRELEEKTGRKVEIFSYPDGKFNDEIKKILVDNGFNAACSTIRGVNSTDTDPFALRRIPFTMEPFDRFVLRMAGRA